MFTCAEYVKKGREECPENIYVHGVDLLSHVLRGDTKNTILKTGLSVSGCLSGLRDAVESWQAADVDYSEIEETAFSPESKRVYVKSDSGELDLGRYIGGDRLPFDDCKRRKIDKSAVVLLLDAAMPANERDLSDMVGRHAKIYRAAVKAESEGRPCKVVAVENMLYEDWKTVALHITIKDFDEPIFPAIWGAYITNATTNDFCNCIASYFVGTSCWGNGTPKDYDASAEYNPMESEIVNGRRLKFPEVK